MSLSFIDNNYIFVFISEISSLLFRLVFLFKKKKTFVNINQQIFIYVRIDYVMCMYQINVTAHVYIARCVLSIKLKYYLAKLYTWNMLAHI